jgi:hypothetical protein
VRQQPLSKRVKVVTSIFTQALKQASVKIPKVHMRRFAAGKYYTPKLSSKVSTVPTLQKVARQIACLKTLWGTFNSLVETRPVRRSEAYTTLGWVSPITLRKLEIKSIKTIRSILANTPNLPKPLNFRDDRHSDYLSETVGSGLKKPAYPLYRHHLVTHHNDVVKVLVKVLTSLVDLPVPIHGGLGTLW